MGSFSRIARLVGVIIVTAAVAAFTITAAAVSSSHKHWTVAGVMANVTDPYFITMNCGAKHAANQHGITLKWSGAANPDIPTEIQNLRLAVLKKPDGVFQTPFDPNAFVAPVKDVMKQGIPYVMVDGALAKDVAYKYIVTVHTGLDKIVGEPIAKAMGRKGKIGIIAYGTSNLIDVVRYKPWVNAWKTKYPNIDVLPIQYTASDTAKSAAAASALITAHPDLTAIFATNGPELDGVASAVKAAGKVGKIKVYGYAAGVAQDLARVRQGLYSGIFVQAPYLEGVKAIEVLSQFLNNRKTSGPVHSSKPYEINTPLKFITKSNINSPSTKPFYGLTSANGPTCK